jgi:myo-inositol 2-dehydrogenase / D-chiro-inositol 1-dehydrogenase
VTRPIRIGLLGCGAIAREHHLPSLRGIAGAEVVAVADPDPDARARLAQLTDAPLYEQAEEVLGLTDVDAVVIATPPHTHAELAIAAARRDKHLYVEKPLATIESDAVQVLEEVRRSNVSATMGFNRRRHPLNARARQLIADGRVGRVLVARTAFCEPASPSEMSAWRGSRSTGGGVLLDLGSHHFDLLRWLLDANLEVLDATTSSEGSEQDGALLRLSTETGVDVQSVFSSRAAHIDVIEVVGDRGSLRIDRHRGSLDLVVRRSGRYGVRPAWSRPGTDVYAWRARRLVGRGGDPSYRRTLQAFVERASGAGVDAPTLDDGLRSLQVVLAAERLAGRDGSGAA